jgi:hypothetical protein
VKKEYQVRMKQNVLIYIDNKLERQVKNLVVTSGQEWLAERMISDVPDVMSHMAIGTTSGFSANIAVNGDMELDSNWSDYGTPSSNTRSAVQFHGGSFSREFTSTGANYDGIVSDAFTSVTGEDLFVQAWVYPTATTSIYVALRQGDDKRDLYHQEITGLTAGVWNKIEFSIVELVGGAGGYIAFFSENADTFYIDDVLVYTSVALTETTLAAELNRQALTSAVRTGNYITYSALWAAGVGTGAIKEAGLFNAGAAGTMLSRVAFPTVNKAIDKVLSVVWRILLVGI